MTQPQTQAPTTRRDILGRITERLTPLYGEREARSIARLAASELSGLSVSALLTDPGAPLQIDGLEEILSRLAAGRPVQYELGSTEFCGHRFAVREGVLIPRPETEELAAWIVREEGRNARKKGLKTRDGMKLSGEEDLSGNEASPAIGSEGDARRAPRILDVGTGSGCIAATLAAELPEAEVYAADISAAALRLAEENARALGVRITLRRADALLDLPAVFPEGFDTIVSNPPYVPRRDRAAMHPNVRNYEPEEALFVPDDDPLLFYRAIARAARRMLRPGGRLYFEIYHPAAESMRRMLTEEGYIDIVIREDLAGKQRMTCSRLN